MNSKLKSQETDFLFSAVLQLRTLEECCEFFDDLCTVSEIKAMSQRLQVAKLLREKHVYTDIVKLTGASTATISRVNRCLEYGSDGYAKILKRMSENE